AAPARTAGIQAMTRTSSRSAAPATTAEIVREYPLDRIEGVHGVTYDGTRIWAATNERLIALDPDSGAAVRKLERRCDAGTAFDGKYLYQLTDSRIEKIDPGSGEVVSSIPAPAQGGNTGLAWAEGS